MGTILLFYDGSNTGIENVSFEASFMIIALIAGIILGAVTALLKYFVLKKHFSFFSAYIIDILVILLIVIAIIDVVEKYELSSHQLFPLTMMTFIFAFIVRIIIKVKYDKKWF